MGSVDSFDSQYTTYAKVNFCNIRDRYSHNEDLACGFDLGSYRAAEGDRVAIYKSGWMYVKDYFLFEWVHVHTGATEARSVTFNKYCLPKESADFYQFCYVTVDNEVLGASSLFQFVENPIMSASTPQTAAAMTSSEVWTDTHMDKEIHKLREENEVLKETLKLVTSRAGRNYDREISELKMMIFSLQSAVQQMKDVAKGQQEEIESLKKNSVQVSLELVDSSGEKEARQSQAVSVHEFNIGELESLPPFPFAK